MLQQHIGKAPGGGAKVQTNPPFRVQPEMRERMRKREPAAGDPGVVLPAHFKRRAIGQQIACLLHPLGIAEHLAGQDKRLRPGAAFREPKRHQQQIGALFWRAGH